MAENSSEIDYADELVRLKALELRRMSESQSELILEMSAVGFSNPRIADLLGTSTDTVRGVVNKAKKKK